jgi:hypothetical protein
MEYYLIRKKFCELSGRYDLMNADYTDNGADFFINAGQQALDRKQGSGNMQAKYVKQITAGTIKVPITGLRAVHNVWVGSSTDGLTELGPVTLKYMRNYYEKQLGDVAQGTPIFYAPAIFRPYPDTATSTSLSGYYDIDDLQLHSTTPNHFPYSGIIIAPPPDATMYLSVYGLYYSPTLSATLAGAVWTQTKSFWSEVFPSMLLKAALYELEVFYRNTEGAKDWDNPLMRDVLDMDKDLAEQESVNINEMRG